MIKKSENNKRFSYTNGFRKIDLQDKAAWFRAKKSLWYNPLTLGVKESLYERGLIIEKEFDKVAQAFFPLTIGYGSMEAGYIFAPYIPMQREPTIIECLEDFEPTQEIVARYANRQVNNRFYGRVNINDLNNE